MAAGAPLLWCRSCVAPTASTTPLSRSSYGTALREEEEEEDKEEKKEKKEKDIEERAKAAFLARISVPYTGPAMGKRKRKKRKKKLGSWRSSSTTGSEIWTSFYGLSSSGCPKVDTCAYVSKRLLNDSRISSWCRTSDPGTILLPVWRRLGLQVN